jgi:cytochrome c peroxidase
LAVLPSEVPSPAENPTTAEKVALGRRLFFDARLSGDNAMSCATCHLPSKAWTDGLPLAKGREGATLSRNTPALLNLAFFERYMWDGRANSLEAQALLPIQSPAEMHQDLDELVRELNAISGYVEQFHSAFGSGATRENVAQALAAFQRTLVTGETPLDRYLRGDRRALSEAARRGLELFLGEAGCIRCHHGPLLSDGRFYRLGVTFDDPGLAAVSGDREDWGKFRTPSLRNVADTGPYMHNGSLKSLEEVVTFYYRGVPTVAAGEPALDIKPLLGRSFSEIPDLVSFLEALSGDLPVVSTPELP